MMFTFQAGHREDFCFKMHNPPFPFIAKGL